MGKEKLILTDTTSLIWKVCSINKDSDDFSIYKDDGGFYFVFKEKVSAQESLVDIAKKAEGMVKRYFKDAKSLFEENLSEIGKNLGGAFMVGDAKLLPKGEAFIDGDATNQEYVVFDIMYPIKNK